MSAAVAVPPGVTVRDATPADNTALIALASACPMHGDVGLCVDREPDFFALNRLEGETWRVGVAEGVDGAVLGCVAVARRGAWLHGRPAQTMYVGDLKVHPTHRGGRVADALTRFARDACRDAGGSDVPTLLTILAGNRAMERRADGPRGLPGLARFATIRSHSIPLLARRRVPGAAVRVARARAEDVEEMSVLWTRIAAERQFAPRFDGGDFARWVDGAPGLVISDYWLARDGSGRVVGYLGVWDQDRFKRLRVTTYSPRFATVRHIYNAAARLTGGTRLPAAGEPLRHATVVHVCVSPSRPEVLRTLLGTACNALIGRGYSLLNVGLDVRDPLTSALRGLLARPTDVHAYVTTPAGRYEGARLDDRPLHYETALV